MQLEGLSQLHKAHHATSHVYYVPAAGGPPALSKSIGVVPKPAMEDEKPQLTKKASTASKDDSCLDPLESKVLDEVKKAVSEPQPTLLRRHTFAVGDMRDLKKAAGLQHGTQEAERERRLAELMLPGLKRELCNASLEEKGRVASEIAEVQHWLGDDVPPARTFLVSRKCDKEEDSQPMIFTRSVSW